MGRRSITRRARLAVLISAVLVAGLFTTAAPAGASVTIEEVPGLTALAAPFGLALGPGGTIIVGQQGAPPDPESGFPGLPGSIIRWKKGEVTQLVGFEGQGPSDVSVAGNGRLSYTLGQMTEEDYTQGNDVGIVNGRRLGPSTDLGGYEVAENPDSGNSYGPTAGVPADCLAQFPEFLLGELEPYTGGVDSNVYAVTEAWGGNRLVADAGANAVHLIGHGGEVIHSYVLPPVTQTVTAEGIAAINQELPPDAQVPDCLIGLPWAGEPVPTGVEVGPDGWIYVSSLPGFPEQGGRGAIYRINPLSGAMTRWADGFTSAVDVTFGPDGDAYVVELFGGFGGGALKRIDTHRTADGLVAGDVTTIAQDSDGLVLPIRAAVDRDGAIYVAANLFGEGRVVRITT